MCPKAVPRLPRETAGEWHTGPERRVRIKHADLNMYLPMRPIYCALMGQGPESVPAQTGKKSNGKMSYVFLSHDPILSTILHNQKLVYNRETRKVAPHWQLHGAAGPFKSLSSARACGQALVDHTRTKSSKRKVLRQLAAHFGVRLYTDTEHPPGGLKAYLEKHAPADFLSAVAMR
jgi:hypothetical protein